MEPGSRRLIPEAVERLVRSCLGKIKYPSKEAATEARLECERKRGTPLRVYLCPRLDHWHLTATPHLYDMPALCGRCLEVFEPLSRSDWECPRCKAGGAP